MEKLIDMNQSLDLPNVVFDSDFSKNIKEKSGSYSSIKG